MAKRSDKIWHLNRGNPCRITSILMVAIYLFGSIPDTKAQADRKSTEPALTAKVIAPAAPSRSHAPIPFVVTLDWNGPGMLEGRIEYFIHPRRKRAPINSHWSDSVFVTTGAPTRLPLMLPSLTGGIADLDFDRGLQLRFVDTSDHKHELGSYKIDPGSARKRHFSICVSLSNVNSGHIMTATEGQFWYRFRFEELGGKLVKPFTRNDGVLTSSTLMSPTELPTRAVNYCAYDIVLLQDGVSDLTDRQKQAVRGWVRAGGSLILATTKDQLEATNTFLRVHLNAEAVLVETGDAAPLALHHELGRVLALPPGFDPSHQPPDKMVRILAFVWQLATETIDLLHDKADENAQFARSMGIETASEKVASERSLPKAAYRVDAGATALDFTQSIFKVLMPKGVRAIPIFWATAVVIIFICLIGPVDYYLFGRLKKRMLTWLFFPLVAIACTGFIVRKTEKNLTHTSRGGQFTLVDIASNGSALSETVLAVHFSPRHGILELRAKDSLHSDVLIGMDGDTAGNDTAWSVKGAYPSHYKARRPLSQWAPVLARTSRIEGASSDLPAIDWDRLKPSDFHAADKLDKAVYKEARRVLGKDIAVIVWHHGLRSMYPHNNFFRVIRTSQIVDQLIVEPSPKKQIDQLWLRAGRLNPKSQWIAEDTLLTESKQGHSPSGSQALEDLRIADVKDPAVTVILIVHRKGDDFVVYRRIFRTTQIVPL